MATDVLVEGIRAWAKSKGLNFQMEEDCLGIWRIDKTDDEDDVFYYAYAGTDLSSLELMYLFVVGYDYAMSLAETAEKAAYERGVRSAWADVKRRLKK